MTANYVKYKEIIYDVESESSLKVTNSPNLSPDLRSSVFKLFPGFRVVWRRAPDRKI